MEKNDQDELDWAEWKSVERSTRIKAFDGIDWIKENENSWSYYQTSSLSISSRATWQGKNRDATRAEDCISKKSKAPRTTSHSMSWRLKGVTNDQNEWIHPQGHCGYPFISFFIHSKSIHHHQPLRLMMMWTSIVLVHSVVAIGATFNIFRRKENLFFWIMKWN